MQDIDFSSISWLAPWQPVTAPEQASLEAELAREVGPRHPLFHAKARVIARRQDNDDVLLHIEDNTFPLAVVHLTWSGSVESDPAFPYTRRYANLDEWVEQCMRPDHAESEGTA